MRLNENNYDTEQQEIYSSQLTSEMNTKIAIVSNKPMDLLETKIYSILKREFSVIMTQGEENAYKFPILNLVDVEYTESFLIFNKVKYVIVTSDIILGLIRKQKLNKSIEIFKKFQLFCKKKEIKIIYVNIKYLFQITHEGNCILHGAEDDEYKQINKKLSAIVQDNDNNLIINISTYYGLDDYGKTNDFLQYILLNNSIADKTYADILVEPILSDELAMFISENISTEGIITVDSSDNQITIREWEAEIKKYFVYKTHKVNSTDQDTDTKFSKTHVGGRTELKQKNCAFNLVYKYSPLEYYLDERVAESRVQLGKKLAEGIPQEVIDRVDYIVPVPKTGLYYAMGLSHELGIPYIQALSKDTNEIRSFQVLDANVRKEIIKNKINPIKELIKGKKIILVDEAIFTGTTLKVVCKMLKECGVEEIHLAIPTPECRNQCPYYVQPKRSMLLEYVREDMLEEYFNVESVTFQNREEFRNKVLSLGSACVKCFLGEE